SIGFQDGGNRLILGGGGKESRIALWDVATQLELVRLESKGEILDVSSGGGLLIADSRLHSKSLLQLWRAPSWEEIERAEAARPNVTAAVGR
ncbi:MAG: hypothetical protein JNL10_13205, partial [Verrucomicrobiales bacterium]|nr:hypothetical protein [Verrucomicrobiales bacterium]